MSIGTAPIGVYSIGSPGAAAAVAGVIISAAIVGIVGGSIAATATVATAAVPVTVTASITGLINGTVSAAAAVTTPAPLVEPVSVAEAKTGARMDLSATALDAQVKIWIASARQMAEQRTNRHYVRKNKRFTFTDWPMAALVMPMHEPVAVAISYWGEAGWTQLDTAEFVFFEHNNGTAIAPALTNSWPALAAVAGGPRIRVDVTAGPADPATAPECVKNYIMSLVGYWYENPTAGASSALVEAPFLRFMLDGEVVY